MAEIVGAVVGVGTLILGMCQTYATLKKDAESSNGMEIRPTLEDAMRELCALRDDREKKFAAHCGRMQRTNIYHTWVEMVNNLEARAKQLVDKHEERKRKMLKTPFSRLAKKMKETTFKALRLYRQVIDVMMESDPPRAVELVPPKIKEYPTLQKSLDLILQHLKDATVKGVRVYGMFGVGKTTIMQNLHNHPDVANMFDLLIWVNVSDDDCNNFTTSQMQEAIAKRLILNMEDRDNFKDRIGNMLRGKSYLLLLDGVNEELNRKMLEEIGILPSHESRTKIILTCRERHVCSELVDRSVKIKPLSGPETQKMFRDVLGASRTSKLVPQVIEYCCNIPYLIKMIASAFIDPEKDWETGLQNLIYFPNKGDPAMKKVYKRVEFFCNQLEGRKSDCFLYCALYPRGSDIDTNCLLDCWTAEELCDTRMYARAILNELKMASYLAEDLCGSRGEYVRIEKYIWKVAQEKLLADTQRKHLVNNPPDADAEDWNQNDRISLVNNNLRALPKCPESLKLFTLFLQNNQNLNMIPTTFFEKIGKLRVLNLQNTGIVSLPPSVGRLEKLKVLYLNDCTSLLKLPSEIGELGNLEVLDIRGTGVEMIHDPFIYNVFGFLGKRIRTVLFGEPNSGPWEPFPNNRRQSCLKRLLVSFNKGNENFSRNVLGFCEAISNISTTVEELVIDVNSFKIFCNKEINVVRDSVATMTKLTLLKFIFIDVAEEVIKVEFGNKKIYFPKASDLPSFLNLESTTFEVYIGCSISPRQTPEISEYLKYVKICNAQDRSGPTPNISRLLSTCNALELVDDGDLVHLSQFVATNFNGVKGCLIEGCRRIEAIADGSDQTILATPILPHLMELYMKKLPLLGSIWKGPWKAGSLVTLDTLSIDDCVGIVELLTESRISSELRNLRRLILTNLQKLEKICVIPDSKWPALEELSIQGCPLLTELPFENENVMKLRKLILVDLLSLTRICANELVRWPALENLQMHGCLEISTLPLSTESTLNLRKLILIDLPKFTTLGKDASLVCPALEEFEIRGCPSLAELPFDMA